MFALALSVFLINGLMKDDWPEALLFALAVAVGLTPELLPMIVTVNLAKGAIRMAKKRVIVKRLNAIQNFGAMDVLCTDKTGTLTQNRVSLSLHLDVDGRSDARVLEYAYLNSRSQTGLKSMLDVAVLEHVELGRNVNLLYQYQSVDEIPFDFTRKRLSVILSRGGGGAHPGLGGALQWLKSRVLAQSRKGAVHVLICEGAVEETLACCKYLEKSGRVMRLDTTRREQALAKARELSEDGLRLVAVAYREIARPRKDYSVADERELVLLGFIAFLDPPKESAKGALATLKASGVEIKILTGDNEVVTQNICREVGLAVDRIVRGPDIEKLDDHQLATLVEEATIFAKLSPDQKRAHRHRATRAGACRRVSRRPYQ
jgi:Mg2+-importing ATPase